MRLERQITEDHNSILLGIVIYLQLLKWHINNSEKGGPDLSSSNKVLWLFTKTLLYGNSMWKSHCP